MASDGFSATITSASGSTLYDVNEPNERGGKYLRQFDPGDIIADIFKWKPPGVNGSYVLRNGITGHKIRMTVRYVANGLNDLEEYIMEDLYRFSTEAQTIKHNDQTYNGCNLVSGLTRRTTPIRATGRYVDQVFVDILLTFTEDLPNIPSEEEEE